MLLNLDVYKRQDPLYRGAFLGLNTVHTQAHMLRAIMEGVVFCLADCNDLLKDQGIEITSLRACGGGSTSPVYRKMLADLFRCGIHTPVSYTHLILSLVDIPQKVHFIPLY